MGYWYHYAIMFEALFILTTVDTGTRVARYVLQELMGKVHKPFGNNAWLPGNLITSSLVVLGWGYLIYTGTYFHHLAAVRNRKPVAGDHRAGGDHYLPDQHGQAEICLDHGGSDVLRGRHYGDGGSAGDQEYFLAIDLEAGSGLYRLPGFVSS